MDTSAKDEALSRHDKEREKRFLDLPPDPDPLQNVMCSSLDHAPPLHHISVGFK